MLPQGYLLRGTAEPLPALNGAHSGAAQRRAELLARCVVVKLSSVADPRAFDPARANGRRVRQLEAHLPQEQPQVDALQDDVALCVAKDDKVGNVLNNRVVLLDVTSWSGLSERPRARTPKPRPPDQAAFWVPHGNVELRRLSPYYVWKDGISRPDELAHLAEGRVIRSLEGAWQGLKVLGKGDAAEANEFGHVPLAERTKEYQEAVRGRAPLAGDPDSRLGTDLSRLEAEPDRGDVLTTGKRNGGRGNEVDGQAIKPHAHYVQTADGPTFLSYPMAQDRLYRPLSVAILLHQPEARAAVRKWLVEPLKAGFGLILGDCNTEIASGARPLSHAWIIISVAVDLVVLDEFGGANNAAIAADGTGSPDADSGEPAAGAGGSASGQRRSREEAGLEEANVQSGAPSPKKGN